MILVRNWKISWGMWCNALLLMFIFMSKCHPSFIIFCEFFFFLNINFFFFHGKSYKVRRHLTTCLNLFFNLSQKLTIFFFYIIIKRTLIFIYLFESKPIILINKNFPFLILKNSISLACKAQPPSTPVGKPSVAHYLISRVLSSNQFHINLGLLDIPLFGPTFSCLFILLLLSKANILFNLHLYYFHLSRLKKNNTQFSCVKAQ